MQMKVTMRHHLALVRVAINRKSTNVLERMWRKRNLPTLLGRMQSATGTMENSVKVP